jgi:uncharacterized protein YjcR
VSDRADSAHDGSRLPSVDQLIDTFQRAMGQLIRCLAQRQAAGCRNTPQELARSLELAAREIGESAGELQKFTACETPPATAEEVETRRTMVNNLLMDSLQRTLGHLVRCLAQREAIGCQRTPEDLARSLESAAREIGESAGVLQNFTVCDTAPAINRNAPTAEEAEFLRAMLAELSLDDGPIVFQPREERVQ